MNEFPYQEPYPMGGTDGEPEPRDSVVVGRKDASNEVCLRCESSRTAIREMMATGGTGNLTIVRHILENCPACSKALGGRK